MLPVVFEQLRHLYQSKIQWLNGDVFGIKLFLALFHSCGHCFMLGFDLVYGFYLFLHILCVVFLISENFLIHELLLLLVQRVSFLELIGQIHHVLL